MGRVRRADTGVYPKSPASSAGRGAEGGVLIRNAEALEILEKVTTIVVDKTGTLTEGKPKLVTIEPQPGMDAATLLRLTASLEHVSEHPLAAAIVAVNAVHSWGIGPCRQPRGILGAWA